MRWFLLFIITLTSCRSIAYSELSSGSSRLVRCRATNSGLMQLTRKDGAKIGVAVSEQDCFAALDGMNAGMICSKSHYSGRRGWAATVIGTASVRTRATGHAGTQDVATCNKMIRHADKMVFCSFSGWYGGGDGGWKTTRSYRIPPEPARYPHRFGASSPKLEECLAVAEGSLVIWTERNTLVHQTCRWGGAAWFPNCASNPNLQMGGGSGSVQRCLASIQTPRSGCETKVDAELSYLRTQIEP